MKSFFKIIIGLLGLVVFAVAAVTVVVTNNRQIADTPCQELDNRQVNSIRVLGLVVENRRLLAVRLEAEKNYSPPGGHSQLSENPEEALVREMQEEVGFVANEASFKSYGVDCENRNGQVERTHYYLIEDWSGVVVLSNKNDKIKWVDYEYASDSKADTELTKALEKLRTDDLID